MMGLLVYKEKLKNFYAEHEFYVNPIIKFISAFIALTLIKKNVGYNDLLTMWPVIMGISVIMAFMPWTIIITALTAIMCINIFTLSIELGALVVIILLIMLLLYFRFTPTQGIFVLFVPMAFFLKIPYIVPIIAGLICTPVSIVSVTFGTIVYYMIAVIGKNADAIQNVASEGTVYVDGMDTKDADNILKVRQTAGMVFQNPDNQIVGTLVDEEVGFGPENIGVPTEEIWERVEKSLKAVGMYKFRNASPNKLSGGQKQRVAIAGIVAMKPKCIVLDEPTAMLDPLGRKEVINVLHELNQKEGVTIILITHYMEEVIDADHVFVMDGGKLVMEGTPRQVFSQVDKLKSLRLDVPQVTELAYELKKAGLPVKDGIIRNEELVEELKRLDNN